METLSEKTNYANCKVLEKKLKELFNENFYKI